MGPEINKPQSLSHPDSSIGKESISNEEDLDSIPGLERSPGQGIGYPLQYSGLENPMDCIDHGSTKSQTRLSDFCFHFHIYTKNGFVYIYIYKHICRLPRWQ